MCRALVGTDSRPLLLRRRASRPQLKRDPLDGPDHFLLSVQRLVRTLRFIGQLVRPSTWRLMLRAALPDTTATAQYRDLTLKVIDVRPPASRDVAQLVELVTDALRRLSAADQGFGELVTSHLRSVLALPPGRVGASWAARAYGSTFEGAEGRNPHYLASRLVWAATQIRLRRDAERSGRRPDERQLERSCSEAQRRFLLQFDNADEWIAYMDLEDGDAPPDGRAV